MDTRINNFSRANYTPDMSQAGDIKDSGKVGFFKYPLSVSSTGNGIPSIDGPDNISDSVLNRNDKLGKLMSSAFRYQAPVFIKPDNE